MKYSYIVCGGTFDRLHVGHKAFLKFVFSQGQRVDIGLTTDAYIQKVKANHVVLSFEERKKELAGFLRENNFLGRATIIPIDDVYGQTLDRDKMYEAIVVTEDTVKGAQEINEKRQQQRLIPLTIIIMPLLALSSGMPLSSTLIREGTIGRHGEVYLSEKWIKRTLILPQEVREMLHKPFGELIASDIPNEYKQNPEKIIVVGDATTKRFNQEKVGQVISVIDFAIERKKEFTKIGDLGFIGSENVYTVKNSSGTLSPEVWEVLRKVISRHSGLACPVPNGTGDPESQKVSSRLVQDQEMLKPQHHKRVRGRQVQHDTEGKRHIIIVDGEEDLLVLPLVLLLPLGYSIFYGQPSQGIVRVVATEQTKEKVFEFLQKFT